MGGREAGEAAHVGLRDRRCEGHASGSHDEGQGGPGSGSLGGLEVAEPDGHALRRSNVLPTYEDQIGLDELLSMGGTASEQGCCCTLLHSVNYHVIRSAVLVQCSRGACPCAPPRCSVRVLPICIGSTGV